jgi:hypothetical protein
MDVEHLDTEARRLDGRLGHGVGNIVKLEVEKNFAPKFLDQTDGLWAGVRKELLADLEHAHLAGEHADERLGLIESVDVESDDQTLAHGAAFTNQLEL